MLCSGLARRLSSGRSVPVCHHGDSVTNERRYYADTASGNKVVLQVGSNAQPTERYNCNTPVDHGHWSVGKSGVFDSVFMGRVKCVRCPKCYWEYTSSKGSYPQPKLAGGRKVPYEVMWQRFHHTKGKESAFRCPSRRDGTMRGWDDMKEHIEEEYTWVEVCGDN